MERRRLKRKGEEGRGNREFGKLKKEEEEIVGLHSTSGEKGRRSRRKNKN